MHLHCNGIKYNVSKGLVARGREELGMIWHCIGTWQGQTTRCSHDVAAVENQEGLGGGGGVSGMCSREKGMFDDCFNIIIIFLKYFHVFFPNSQALFTSSWRTGRSNSLSCSAGLLSVLACFHDQFVE